MLLDTASSVCSSDATSSGSEIEAELLQSDKQARVGVGVFEFTSLTGKKG